MVVGVFWNYPSNFCHWIVEATLPLGLIGLMLSKSVEASHHVSPTGMQFIFNAQPLTLKVGSADPFYKPELSQFLTKKKVKIFPPLHLV